MTDPQQTDDVLDVDTWTTRSADEPGVKAAGRRWILLLGVAAGALVLGSVASTTVMLLAGWRHVPEREFTVAVHLEPDASTEQREAVEEALRVIPAVDGVRLETREEAYERFRQRWAGDPEQLAGVEAASMPESLHLTTVGREFDCAPIPRIREMPGVDRLRVVLRPESGRPGAELGC